MMTIDATPLRRAATRASYGLVALAALAGHLGLGVLVWSALSPMDLVGLFKLDPALFPSGSGAWQMRGIAAITAVQIVLWIISLLHLRDVFQKLGGAEVFPADVAHSALLAARWMWAALIWSVVSQVPATALASLAAEPGHRFIAISLGSGQFLAILAALVTGMMAQALRLAAALWEDHREIV
jgi:hypothetical protein